MLLSCVWEEEQGVGLASAAGRTALVVFFFFPIFFTSFALFYFFFNLSLCVCVGLNSRLASLGLLLWPGTLDTTTHVQVCWLDCDFIMQMKLQVHTAIIFALCGHKSCCPVAPKENECGARAAVAHQQKSPLQLFLEGTLAADTASQATLPRTAHALSATLDPTIDSDLPSSAVATPEPVTFTPVAASGQTPTPAAPTK